MGYSFPMLYFSKVEDVGEERFCRFAWNGTVTLIIYYVSGITMINVVPRIVIVILNSRIMQTLRKRIYSGPLFGSINLEGKRNKEMQNIMKIFKSIGQLHDDVILLQLPESLSLLFSCAY